MFNSLANYFWGTDEAAEALSQPTTEQTTDGEHLILNTRQDEDWVVVAAGQDVQASGQEEAGERLEGTTGEEEDGSHRVENAGPARARVLHAAQHNVINATPERLLKESHKAQAERHLKAQKGISRQKCDRENKVYHATACSKKGQSKHSKRVKPAGSKASRVSQRM